MAYNHSQVPVYRRTYSAEHPGGYKYFYLNSVPVDEAALCFTKCNGGQSKYVAATVRELYNLFRPNIQKPTYRQFGMEPLGCPRILQLTIADIRAGGSNERRTQCVQCLC